MLNSLLFISGGEILVVFVVFLLLFGSKKIPDFAKSLGKGMNEFKKATDDIKRELNESTKEVKQDINEVKKDIGNSSSLDL
jgi:TatA/E family protein of Tat protein translocase